MNTLDRTIGYFAPTWQAKRSRSRLHIAQLERGFEAAGRGKRSKGWRKLSSSVNTDLQRELKTIVARSRYLSVNNAYAKRGVSAIPSHVVRKGITPNISGSTKRFEKLFKKWAKSTKCDYEGRHNLYGLQWLIMKTIVESGECLIRKRIYRLDSGLKVPLKLQVLEPDHLDTHKPGTKHGIEFSEEGERVAYWIFPEHPGEAGKRQVSVRIPADEIVHAFETIRPGQLRGIPWLVAVVVRLRDFDEFEDAHLIRQKISSALVGVIHDMEFDEPTSKIKAEDWSEFTPGSWEIMPPGKTVTFSNPPQLNGYSDYTSTQLHAISAGLTVPYEVLTNDYSKVNFSSSRMAFLEFYKSVEHWQDHIMVGQVLNSVFEWFTDIASMAGLGSFSGEISWGLPKREYVDPIKETKAQIMSIRAGLTTLFSELRKQGEDPEELLEEYASTLQALDSKGITLDSDPRKSSKEPNGKEKSQGKDG